MANSTQIDLVSFDAILKTKFDSRPPEELYFRARPFYTMIKKNEKFGGKSEVFTMTIDRPTGVSGTYADALAGAGISNDAYQDLTLTVKEYFGVHNIDDLTMKSAASNADSFLNAQLEFINSIMDATLESVVIDIFGDGSCAIGRRASASTNVITLSKAEEVENFVVGATVVAAAAKSSGSLRTGSAIVVAKDEDAGTITLDDASGISSFADNDYLFVKGKRNTGLKGLAAWIPDTAPTAGDNFYGADRSVNPTSMAGTRMALGGLSLEEGLNKLASKVSHRGGMPDVFLMNFDKSVELINLLGSKVQYIEHQVGKIGFQTLAVQGPKGPIKVLADSHCPKERVYCLTMNTWELKSVGKVPHLFAGDGMRIRARHDANGYQVRVVAYPVLACRAPRWNGVLKLDE